MEREGCHVWSELFLLKVFIGTAAKSAADFSKNPVGQTVDKVRVLKEVNGDGVTRLTRKQRQRLKRKMKGGS